MSNCCFEVVKEKGSELIMNESEEQRKKAGEQVHRGRGLCDQLLAVSHIDGVAKLLRKIKQEILFLQKLEKAPTIKKEQLSCSNLRHLGAVVERALQPGVLSVCKVMRTSGDDKVTIDIISDEGRVWTKVIARNPKSLSALSEGCASFGARSVIHQAQDYLDCAKEYPCFYKTPLVVFEFVSGIEDVLALKLQRLGIVVKGEIIPTAGDLQNDSDDSDSCDSFEENDYSTSPCLPTPLEYPELDTLNLDVTTMMVYVSNLTNGSYNFVFKQPLLSQQAVWEAQRPARPILENLFKDKTLVCCESAWNDFQNIVNVLGGPKEKERTAELQKRLTVMPDDINGPDEPKRADLRVRGRIRLRSKVVFNFGQRIKALTVSANEGFVRAAQQQGVTYAAFIHESRALTEQKEATATVCILPTS